MRTLQGAQSMASHGHVSTCKFLCIRFSAKRMDACVSMRVCTVHVISVHVYTRMWALTVFAGVPAHVLLCCVCAMRLHVGVPFYRRSTFSPPQMRAHTLPTWKHGAVRCVIDHTTLFYDSLTLVHLNPHTPNPPQNRNPKTSHSSMARKTLESV
jgi:hypothetical protein